MHVRTLFAAVFLIVCSVPAMAQFPGTPVPFPLFPEVRTECPMALPLPAPYTPLEQAQQAFVMQAMAADTFNPQQFYSCAWVGCGTAAVVSWLFGGPPAFAAGCTGVMFTCAARAAGIGMDQLPPELKGVQ